VPVADYKVPPGIIRVGGEWYFEEFGPGRGVGGLGLNDPWPGSDGSDENGLHTPPPATVEDRRSILDLFRN
jgi:penicillin-binding protein 1A